MGGAFESQKRLSVQRGQVEGSRSTPNHQEVLGRPDEPVLLSPLEVLEVNLKVVGGLMSLIPVSNWPRLNLEGGAPCRGVRRTLQGAVAQLGERLICTQEVAGSIPTSSTSGRQQGANGPVAQMARAHP